MTAADDLIRRRDAVNAIQASLKKVYTAARRQGYKQAMDILAQLPSAKEKQISMTEPVFLSPAPLHSFWFYNAGWFFCDNCGGNSGGWKTTPYCPHCGARMDAILDEEIE